MQSYQVKRLASRIVVPMEPVTVGEQASPHLRLERVARLLVVLGGHCQPEERFLPLLEA